MNEQQEKPNSVVEIAQAIQILQETLSGTNDRIPAYTAIQQAIIDLTNKLKEV